MKLLKNRSKSRSRFSVWSIAAIIIGIVHTVPFYISLNIALKSKTDLSSRWLPPSVIHWENFTAAIEKAKIVLAMGNSSLITAAGTVLIVLLASMASYPLARNKSKLNRFVITAILGVMMVPPLSMLVPLVTIVTRLGAVSTYWGIVLVLTTSQLPIAIFLYTNFIKTIPSELDDAALVDGCSRFSIFYRIILPLLKPVTATVFILAGVALWNDYQFSLYLLQSPRMKVVTLAVSTFFSQSSSNLGAAAAAAVIAVLPVAVAFVFLQRYFVSGMVDSAVKG